MNGMTLSQEYRETGVSQDVTKKPPKGYAHLASIATAIGVHKSRLYEAEKLGRIKPDGQYRVGGNGRLINYYKITKIAKKYKKTICAKKLDQEQPGIACYGQLPAHIRTNLSLLNKAFGLANRTMSHG